MAHRYIIGGYSTGKTSLLFEMINESIAQGHGVCFIDPHGQTLHGATVFDPETTRWNPLKEPVHPALAASLFQDTAKSAWDYADMPTPVMDMYLFFSAAALIETGHNLSDVLKLLTDKQYRSTLNISDEVTRKFWNDFETLSDKDKREISSTLNKFYMLLADPRLRRMFSVNKKGMSLSDFLSDDVLHVRLPFRDYGKSKTKLIGSLVISYITQLLLERNDPRPYDLYIDDAHLFAHDVVKNAFVSTSRYGLSTTIAHQNIKQIDGDLFETVMGNTDERFVFRVSEQDGQALETWMPPNHSKTKLDRLTNFTYRRFPWDGHTPDGITLPLEN